MQNGFLNRLHFSWCSKNSLEDTKIYPLPHLRYGHCSMVTQLSRPNSLSFSQETPISLKKQVIMSLTFLGLSFPTLLFCKLRMLNHSCPSLWGLGKRRGICVKEKAYESRVRILHRSPGHWLRRVGEKRGCTPCPSNNPMTYINITKKKNIFVTVVEYKGNEPISLWNKGK